MFLRPSCYTCKFRGKYRESDITLADFWGIENVNSVIDDDKEVSLVIANSTSGVIILKEIENKISYIKTNFCKSIHYNKMCLHSPIKYLYRDVFLKVLQIKILIN